MENNKTFYIIYCPVNKGHKHYTIKIRTFTDLDKAWRYMQKNYPSVAAEITTYKDGSISIKIAKEPTEKRPLF